MSRPPVSAAVRVLVLAKAPQLGRVKTRLIPALGPQGATRLHARMLEHTVQTVIDARLGAVELWCTPQPNHSAFVHLQRVHGVTLYSQVAGNLGRRMYQAARQALSRCQAVVIVGTDCPVLDCRRLHEVVDALLGSADAVAVPAEDGGYVLLALKDAPSRLFADIAWGHSTVWAQTRERMEELGWESMSLPALWDVDRPEDLLRLRKEKPQFLRGL